MRNSSGSATSTRDGRIPGPRGLAALAAGFRLLRAPLGEITRARDSYGEVALYKLGPIRFVLTHNPDIAHHVLVSNAKNYHKSPTYRGLKLVMGEGLVTSEGEFWKRQRKLAQPAFHHRCLVGFVETMARCTRDLLAKWDARADLSEVELHAEMLELTLRTVGHTLFSTELGSDAPAVHGALAICLERANREVEMPVPIPAWFPTPGNMKFRRSLAILDDIVLRMIAERRQDPNTQPDLLGLLMAATDETGKERMTDKQLRDELMTLLLAGHETVANALSWTFYLLASHPEIADAVAEEAAAVLGDDDPNFESLRRLELTERVINESMRLYPPAWIVERQAQGPDVLGGYEIRPKTIVAVPTYTMHRHPALWEEPARFDPDRFLPERREERHRFAFIPFGGGPRVCIGNAMAMTEAKLMVSMIARRFRLERRDARTVLAEPGVTLRPRGGVPMILRRRGKLRAGHAAA